MYWALELADSGYAHYVFRRLLVITSEDVGLAEPTMPATIHALHQNALTLEASGRARAGCRSSMRSCCSAERRRAASLITR